MQSSRDRQDWTVHAPGARGAQFGQHNTQINTFVLPEAEVTWPIRVGAVPPPADCYQHRAEAGRLDQIMGGTGTAVLTQILSGLGGVGKSQLAVGYARAAEPGTDLLMWVSAITRDAVLSAYTEAAHRLGYRLAREPADAAAWLLNWLAAEQDRDWLIVLDDLTDPAHLRGLWPQGPRGRTVVTTRRTDAVLSAHGRRLLPVGLYSPDEAVQYLGRKLGDGADLAEADLAEAAELAADLGQLPLALAQAAAFMLDRGETCAGYRRRLRDERRALADLFPDDALADDYQATVTATWSISIELADRLAPAGLARPLLELASVLDPNGFPAELVQTEAALGLLDPDHRDPASARDALHNLARLSLLDLDRRGGPNAVRVHGLVQRATRESVTAEGRLPAVALAAADAVAELWPDADAPLQQWQTIGANALTVMPHAGAALWDGGTHDVCTLVGDSFVQRGLDDALAAHYVTLARDAERHLGADHLETLFARYVAVATRSDLDPAAALAATPDLINDCVRALGPDHDVTLLAREVRAACLDNTDDPAAAVIEFEAVYRDRLRLIGADDRATLSARADLARVRGRAGDHATAISELTALIIDAGRLFGPRDDITLDTAAELAEARTAAGEHDAMMTAYAELIRDCTTLLGADHRRTLTARFREAIARHAAGDPTGATVCVERLLPDARRVLGSDSKNVAQMRLFLAGCRADAGEPGVAVALLDELLAELIPVMGLTTTLVLSVRHDAAKYRGLAGDRQGAVAGLTQLLADRERALGDQQLMTVATRLDLAEALRASDDLAAAAECYRKLVADAGNPALAKYYDELYMLHELSEIQHELGDAEGALVTDRALVELSTERLGPQDETTMAYRWQAVGGAADLDPVGALPEIEELLADEIRLTGPDSETTLGARRLVITTMAATGRTAPQEQMIELLADQRRVLGAGHADSLRAWADDILTLLPEEDEAPLAIESLLADLVRVLGPDDPDTLYVRYILGRLPDPRTILPMRLAQARRLLADHRRVLGDEHPHTLEIRWGIAFRQRNSGDLIGAIVSLRAVLADVERCYDGEDLDLEFGRESLAEWEATAEGR